ncbi:putative ABC transporter permease protein YurM [Paenibacillus curdlanolyticus]|nr:putative ABC transporter permease protein YurM [Paenibacillus curdlanolyticus]
MKVALETGVHRKVATSRTAARKIGSAVLYIVLIAIAILQLLPLVWLLFFSLKNSQEIFDLAPFALPRHPKWENYSDVWSSGNIDRYFINSVVVTLGSVVLTILLASFVTYAVTRMRWKLSSFVLGIFMLGMMIPVHSTLIPLYNLYEKLDFINKYHSLIVSYTAFNLPITIMIMLGFYAVLPKEVEEAAIMDGCSINRLFFQIILPMTMSVMMTAAIINMIYNWNEFIFVNTFISSDSLKTLTVGVQNFIGQYQANWGAIGATLMISILPIMVVFLLLSNRIVEGLAAGSVKG